MDKGKISSFCPVAQVSPAYALIREPFTQGFAAIRSTPSVLQRARRVLPLYEQATSLLKQGIWGICAAEKPSIQARQAEQAPRPAMQKHPVEQSPRSHRRGAVPLMAAWSVADGLVSGQCHKRKRKVSFRSF
jgi:hypothetical protein